MENNISDIIKAVTSETDLANTKNDLRLFLIAQAKKELCRIVSLTQTLDSIEKRYQDAAMAYLSDHSEDTVNIAPMMIQTISKCLERSYDILKQVTKDDKLFNVLFIDNSKTITANLPESLGKASSRAKVRDSVSEILRMLDTDEITEILAEEIKEIETTDGDKNEGIS